MNPPLFWMKLTFLDQNYILDIIFLIISSDIELLIANYLTLNRFFPKKEQIYKKNRASPKRPTLNSNFQMS